jgi:hypothetical protein
MTIKNIVSLLELSKFSKGILPESLSFQGGERLILLQISLLSQAEETQVSLQKQPSVLEAGGSRALFASEY